MTMSDLPHANAATTARGGTATPSVLLQGARHGRLRPRSHQAADRSANAPWPNALQPYATRIEGRRCRLQTSLSCGRREAVSVCAALYPFERPCRARRGSRHQSPSLSASAQRLQGLFQRSSGLSRSRPNGFAIGEFIFGHGTSRRGNRRHSANDAVERLRNLFKHRSRVARVCGLQLRRRSSCVGLGSRRRLQDLSLAGGTLTDRRRADFQRHGDVDRATYGWPVNQTV